MDRVDMTGIMQTVEAGDMVDVENTMNAKKPMKEVIATAMGNSISILIT